MQVTSTFAARLEVEESPKRLISVFTSQRRQVTDIWARDPYQVVECNWRKLPKVTLREN